MGHVGSSEDTASSPKTAAAKLQVPSRGQAAKKRRRNTSGASSEPSTPPEASTGGSLSPNYAYQSIHMPPLTGLSEQFDRSPYPFPAVLASASSPYTYPQMPESRSTTTHTSLQQNGAYKQVMAQGGLESTLAQRNTSVAQFYNIHEHSPRSNTVNIGRPNTSYAERAPVDSYATSLDFNGPASAPHNLALYLNDTALPFEQSHISLPNMPFGMPSSDFGFSQPQTANVSRAIVLPMHCR